MNGTDHKQELVPLYLVPQVLSQNIHQIGGAIRKMVITRTGNHQYAITIETAEKEGDVDE